MVINEDIFSIIFSNFLLKKNNNIKFIYSADKASPVIKKWILIGLNPHAKELIFLTPVPANTMELFLT